MVRRRWRVRAREEDGSAPVEFVLVGVLVITLVLGVVQLALALHVRNTIQDAASDGARWAALADNNLAAGQSRAEHLINLAIGPEYSMDVRARQVLRRGVPIVEVTVVARLPVIGFLGIDRALTVTGHATRELAG